MLILLAILANNANLTTFTTILTAALLAGYAATQGAEL